MTRNAKCASFRRLFRIPAALAPLADRPFRLLWIGQTISSIGDALVLVAFAFAILKVGGTAADIGYVAAIQTVCRMAFILAGGVWADRLPRQFVMLTSDVLRAATQASLAILLLTDRAQLWELGLGAALFGIGQAVFGPASAGLVPETVSSEHLQGGNALISSSRSFFMVGGPAVAGVIIAVLGPGLIFAIDAASFVASAISLSLLRLPPRKPQDRASFRADLAAGWREMAVRPWYWLNLIAHALWNFAIPAYYVIGPVTAARALGGAPAWGTICASWAIGQVAGGIVSMRVRPRRPLATANVAIALTALPLLALAAPLTTWEIAVAAALGGFGLMFLNAVWLTTMQQLIPDAVRSRVNSYDWLISLVVMPAGYAIVGPVASHLGSGATLIGAAFLLGIPSLLVLLFPAIRRIRRTASGKIVEPAGADLSEALSA